MRRLVSALHFLPMVPNNGCWCCMRALSLLVVPRADTGNSIHAHALQFCLIRPGTMCVLSSLCLFRCMCMPVCFYRSVRIDYFACRDFPCHIYMYSMCAPGVVQPQIQSRIPCPPCAVLKSTATLMAVLQKQLQKQLQMMPPLFLEPALNP